MEEEKEITEGEEEEGSELDEEVLTHEEARAIASLRLAKTEPPETLSELAPEKINNFNTMVIMAEEMDSDFLKKWTKKYLYLQVSRNRRGREEIIEVVTGAPTEKKRKGFFSFLRGDKN